MGWAGLDLWSSPTFVPWTPTPSCSGRKTKRQVPTGFFTALQGGELLWKTEPSGLREAQTKARVCQHWGAFGEAYPRSHALTFLTDGRRRVFVRWGRDSPSSCPAGLRRPPAPAPTKAQGDLLSSFPGGTQVSKRPSVAAWLQRSA